MRYSEFNQEIKIGKVFVCISSETLHTYLSGDIVCLHCKQYKNSRANQRSRLI